MIFASLNQLRFNVTSRRDDLISLCYLLVYILNNGELPGIDLSLDLDKKQSFQQAKRAKIDYSIEQLCSQRAQPLRNFTRYVFSLGFKETPDYNKLRQML